MGMRRVPIGRRNLFADRRRALLGVAGLASALLLVLALDGIFAGAMRGVTRYIDTSPADVFVAQQGVRNMHMASSFVPLDALDDIRALPGSPGPSRSHRPAIRSRSARGASFPT